MEKANKKKSIYDIAREAGVSTATVSRVLNNNPNVDYDTRLKILALLEKNSYRPRQVKSKATHIGVILDGYTDSFYLGKYIVGLIEGVIAYASGHQLETSIIPFDASKVAYPEEIASYLMERDLKGAIFINTPPDAKYIYALERLNFPYITIGSHFTDDGINAIDIDNREGMKKAVDYLFSLGHRKIGFLNVNVDQYAIKTREQAFRDSLLAHGIEPKDKYILMSNMNNKNHKEVGYELVMGQLSLLNDIPTAFVCLNDDIAVGAIKGFSKLGRLVPRDISVIGFDDYPDSKFYIPSLTTIRNSVNVMGYIACENVDQWISGNKNNMNKMMEAELVIRDSCSAP